MKKLYILGAIAGILSLTSCDSLLNDNRYPLDTQSNNPTFWNSSINVQGVLNYLYEDYMGYGKSTSWNGTFYFKSLNDDQIGIITSGQVAFAPWNNVNVPSSQSVWDGSYTSIRRCNYVIEGVEGNTMTDADKANYIAQARLNRAYNYYDLVRHFGDVPLVTKVLDPTDEAELYGPRTPRDQVMDFVLEDLNYAVKNISTQDGKVVFSVDMANAMKAEICLYEASYAKYHKNNTARATQFFQEVVNATTPLLNKYTFTDDYASIYNSPMDDQDGMTGLMSNPEVIFMKPYVKSLNGHSLCKYTSTATLICGMSKSAFDSYLFLKDGKPLMSTTETEKGDQGYMDETGLCIQNLLDVRDKRLEATIDPYVYYTGLRYQRENSDLMTSSSGYGVRKYVNPKMEYYYCVTDGQSYTNAPLYWLSKAALEYAEAKAELNQFGQSEFDLSLKKLYERAGLPITSVSQLEGMNDPANKSGISSLLWEIRRCRRCELMFDGFRYWDLIRWHELDRLDTSKNPDINLGANLTPALAEYPAPNVNGYYQNWNNTRTFTEREYLDPIGSQQITLNPNLKQNPGW